MFHNYISLPNKYFQNILYYLSITIRKNKPENSVLSSQTIDITFWPNILFQFYSLGCFRDVGFCLVILLHSNKSFGSLFFISFNFQSVKIYYLSDCKYYISKPIQLLVIILMVKRDRKYSAINILK